MSILESITISHPTLTTIFLLLVCALILGLIYLKCRYQRPDLRAIAIVIMGASYAFAFWDYLPKHSVSITEQRLIALIILSLTLFPLFYKSAKRVRIGFTRYTKNERLKKQNHKCAGCKKTLIKFNIDFDHKNGNRSDNRISNCRYWHYVPPAIGRNTRTDSSPVIVTWLSHSTAYSCLSTCPVSADVTAVQAVDLLKHLGVKIIQSFF